ncbi:MAG TPA: hypothetical protein VNS09_03210 [Solirubrobacter sp.]|nr:hypothetical protein [Solirubrobacter sp.]
MNRVYTFLAVVLAVFAGSAAAAALTPAERDTAHRVAVVAPASSATSARALAARSGAEVRLPRSDGEALGVTHLLAARGYDEVIVAGLDRRTTVDPVAARYPATRFVSAALPSTP